MLSNFDSSEDSSVILKQSLQQTIIKLEKAITLIDRSNKQTQSDSIRIEKTLARNSDLLLTYLQNTDRFEDLTSNNRSIVRDYDSSSTTSPVDRANFSANNSRNNNDFPVFRPKSKGKVNLILVSVLIVSLCFNIYTLFERPRLVVATNRNLDRKEMLTDEIAEEQKNIASQPQQDNLDLTEALENQEQSEKSDLKNPLSLPKNSRLTDNDNTIELPSSKIGTSNGRVTPTVTSSIDRKESKIEKDSLFIEIENQLNRVSDRYQEDIISNLKPNYSNNSLTIFVSSNWQTLNEKEQDKLSEELYQKAKSLDFYRFYLKTIEGDLLARNTVIKDRLIILTHWE